MNTRNCDSSWAPNRTERSVARSTVIFGNMGEFKITRKHLSSLITRQRRQFIRTFLSIFSIRNYLIERVIDPNHLVHDFHWFSIYHIHVRQIAVVHHCTWIICQPSRDFRLKKKLMKINERIYLKFGNFIFFTGGCITLNSRKRMCWRSFSFIFSNSF